MKTFIKTHLLLIFCFLIYNPTFLLAQNKLKLTVLNADVKGLSLDPESAGSLLRREVEKLNLFDVTDKYDVNYLIETNNLKVSNCYGKTCLTDIGKKIQSDKMLSGSFEMYSDMIVISLRLIDVKTESIEKTAVREFLYLPKELQSMTSIVINDLFGIENEPILLNNLTKKNAYENAINQPNKNQLKLDGPRMGFTILTGQNAEIFKSPEDQGGFDGFPMLFQFGYQFEKQYLNEGNFQALFEFIPMITGLDQGQFIPSLSILHGLRGNKKGWEFAFGPTISLTKQAKGYYDPDLGWQLENQWTDTLNANPYNTITRFDSRGEYAFTSGFVFAFGRSIRSGKLNIPFNAYIIPQRNGMRFGLSFGFNARKQNT